MNIKRLFLYLLIASVGVSALLGIGVILFGDFGELEARILGTSLTVTCMSLLGLSCGASIESKRLRMVPMAGIVASILSAVIWIAIIWSNGDGSEYVVKTVFTTTLFAVVFSYASLINFASLDSRFRWAQYAAYFAVSTMAGILFYLIWIENQPNEEFVARVIGVNSIVIAALTVMMPIFHKLSRPADPAEDLRSKILATEQKLAGLKDELEGLSQKEDDS